MTRRSRQNPRKRKARRERSDVGKCSAERRFVSAPVAALSLYHLHSPCRNMGLRDLLSPPLKDRRARSEGRSEVGLIEGAGQVYPVASRHAESTPDLGISPSTSQDQGSASTQMNLSWIFHLTTFCPCTTGRHTISNRILSVFKPGRGRSSKPSQQTANPNAINQNKPDWKSTSYATTKLAINMVKESSDAFPPLKSLAGGLSAILNHCDV